MTVNAVVQRPKGDCKLLTVDVWDTVLRRRCHPDCVKLHVSRFVWLRFAIHLRPDARDPWQLLCLRRQAERELGEISVGKGWDDEYRHTDVYCRWLKLAGFSSSTTTPMPDIQQLVHILDDMEMAQEQYVSYLDPFILGLLNESSVRPKYFLSDFYLPASSIDKLLRHHGIVNLFDGGRVSCEAGLNKRSGRLYRDLHRQLSIGPEHHAHLGDNPDADIRAARTLGIDAIHYQPEPEHGKRLERERYFHFRADFLRKALEQLMGQEGPTSSCSNPEAYAYGRQCSLLMTGFALYVMEQALVDGINQVYFFTREGEFFLEIYRRLVANDVLGFQPPDADLMHVSRLATFAGSLRDCSTRELMRLWNQYSVQSLQAFLISLGLEPTSFTTHAEKYGIDPRLPIRYPWQDPRIIGFLNDSEIKQEINSHLEAKRSSLLAYLKTRGLCDGAGTVGIVDIGWRGTIQDNLAHLLPTVRLHGYYLGLNRYLNDQPPNVQKSAFGPNLNRENDPARLLDCVAPIEMLCNSPNGSVVGYETDEQDIRVCKHADPVENGVYEEYSCHFQAGVLDSLSYWADLIRTHAYTANEIRPVALEQWHGIVWQPPEFLARAYFRLNHNELFGVGGFADKRRLPKTLDLWLAIVSPRHRTKIKQFLTETGWIPGLLACEDINPTFRRSLKLLLEAIKIRRGILDWFQRRLKH